MDGVHADQVASLNREAWEYKARHTEQASTLGLRMVHSWETLYLSNAQAALRGRVPDLAPLRCVSPAHGRDAAAWCACMRPLLLRLMMMHGAVFAHTCTLVYFNTRLKPCLVSM